ncbi:hypothetical protein ACMD2_19554 [Ananas comosus]|uniref:Uncharacterized protein n=1 Tax=Ananas comosus TaxID=4615 RepID=A0A199UIK9_ANACO|nr:hypothetical protein ACMD2_19554 [Ananas comosus]
MPQDRLEPLLGEVRFVRYRMAKSRDLNQCSASDHQPTTAGSLFTKYRPKKVAACIQTPLRGNVTITVRSPQSSIHPFRRLPQPYRVRAVSISSHQPAGSYGLLPIERRSDCVPDRKKGEDVGLICEELGFLFGERTFPIGAIWSIGCMSKHLEKIKEEYEAPRNYMNGWQTNRAKEDTRKDASEDPVLAKDMNSISVASLYLYKLVKYPRFAAGSKICTKTQ